MNVHVGQRGGSYMMENFQELANTKKMNAAALRAGVSTELQYASDAAAMPRSLRKAITGSSFSIADVPNGKVPAIKNRQVIGYANDAAGTGFVQFKEKE
jgi:hypothetical protein